jgi:ABC-type Na+ transport system ATPase subunit NatA
MTFAIDARGLEKVYKGNVAALAGVDLDVKAGDIFALLGPNGAGKTTLMRILTTQFKPTSGEAHIFGLDVVREGGKVRKVIGYVPQETSVWSDINGYENLLIYAKIYGLPSRSRKEVIYNMLESMGLRAAAEQLVKTYSGGMIRKLEIACAMLIRPKILFLDEPTLGLDPAARSWRPLKRSLARPYFSAPTTWTKRTPTQTRLQLSTWGRWSPLAQLTNLSTHFEGSSSKSACPITASMSIRCVGYEVWSA